MVHTVKSRKNKNKAVGSKPAEKPSKIETKEKTEKKPKKNDSSKKKSHKDEEKGYWSENISESEQTQFEDEQSFQNLAFKALVSARFCSAMWNNITDCDETFNYWEPSHFLLYGKGFQTWEYSPAYALRSYTYLLLHVVPTWLYSSILQPNKIFVFYYMRCLLSFFSAYSEAYFFRGVCKEFGLKVGKMYLLFLLFSPGMFISSSAFLPSSFSMYMGLIAYGAWLRQKYELAIFATAISTFLSWPFAGMLGVPIAMDLLVFRKQFKKFISWSMVSTIVVAVPLVRMDSEMYGKFVIPPVNIVIYNILTDRGPSLYGEEPIYFYFLNCLLNFNVAFLAALLAPMFLLISNHFLASNKKDSEQFSSWLEITPFYIWFPLFSIQSHKEERFLYPVFPFIALCGALCINSLEITLSAVKKKFYGKSGLQSGNQRPITVVAGLLAIFFGLSRIVAIVKGYHAPLDLYMELGRFQDGGKIGPNTTVNVCVGKEWYRFPSSFFLPENNWNLKFLESDFKGQLPAEFVPSRNATLIVHPHFNNLNKEEKSRYFDINKCHFLVDTDFGRSSEMEPNYSALKSDWTIVKSLPFLDAAESHRLFRAFYIPLLTPSYCKYGKYNLLKSRKLQIGE